MGTQAWYLEKLTAGLGTINIQYKAVTFTKHALSVMIVAMHHTYIQTP